MLPNLPNASLFRGVLSLGIFFCAAAFLSGQGDLVPPGPPGPTMKTLDQIESRTDLATVSGSATAEHVIAQPGSYYLTENIEVAADNGIEITVSNVSLDLNGYTISTEGSPLTAILLDAGISDVSNVRIYNGRIYGGNTYFGFDGSESFGNDGFEAGIQGEQVANVVVEDLQINGMRGHGVYLDNSDIFTEDSNTVRNVSVYIAGLTGIRAGKVIDSSAIRCGLYGIKAFGTVSNCKASAEPNAADTKDGIEAVNVVNSTGYSEDGHGIDCFNVTNSNGTSIQMNGINAGGNVENSFGSAAGPGIGIRALYNVSKSTGRSNDGSGIVSLFGTVSHSYGKSSGSDTGDHAISCKIAVACTTDGSEDIDNKYNMP